MAISAGHRELGYFYWACGMLCCCAACGACVIYYLHLSISSNFPNSFYIPEGGGIFLHLKSLKKELFYDLRLSRYQLPVLRFACSFVYLNYVWVHAVCSCLVRCVRLVSDASVSVVGDFYHVMLMC